MQELLDWMKYIEDGRQQRKVCHTLKAIFVIVLFATLANKSEWRGTAEEVSTLLMETLSHSILFSNRISL